jgi:hypothetical protein
VLCATDAGGVRNLAPLAPVSVKRGIVPLIATSQAMLGLWGEHAGVDELHIVDGAPSQGLASILKNRRPHACICGTTRYLSPDRLLVQAAKEEGIRTVVVLDEWFNHRLRFEDPDTGELAYLPDAIAVQDQQAREGAVAEGLPAAICHITGSPALAELTQRARLLAAAPSPAPEVLADVGDRPVVTFLSETHAADYGTGPHCPGRFGPFIGYTEVTVRQAILEVLARLGEPVTFIEKLHPAAGKQDIGFWIPETVDFRSILKTDLWALMWHSNLVIGMRSMALLEASILGCEAVSFQPGRLGPELCTAVRLGVIPRMERQEELAAWLAPRLNRKTKQRVIRQYGFARSDAADLVLDLALNTREDS